jgi:hypothetical protein
LQSSTRRETELAKKHNQELSNLNQENRENKLRLQELQVQTEEHQQAKKKNKISDVLQDKQLECAQLAQNLSAAQLQINEIHLTYNDSIKSLNEDSATLRTQLSEIRRKHDEATSRAQEYQHNLANNHSQIQLLQDALSNKELQHSIASLSTKDQEISSNLMKYEVIKTKLKQQKEDNEYTSSQHRIQVDDLKSRLHSETQRRKNIENSLKHAERELAESSTQFESVKRNYENNLGERAAQQYQENSLLSSELQNMVAELELQSRSRQVIENEFHKKDLEATETIEQLSKKYLHEIEALKLRFQLEKQSITVDHEKSLESSKTNLEKRILLHKTVYDTESNELRKDLSFKESEIIKLRSELSDSKRSFQVTATKVHNLNIFKEETYNWQDLKLKSEIEVKKLAHKLARNEHQAEELLSAKYQAEQK